MGIFNALPDNILALSILKAFVDNFIAVQIVQYLFDRIENIVAKRENAGDQHFLLFPQCVQKAFIQIVKSRHCAVKGSRLCLSDRRLQSNSDRTSIMFSTQCHKALDTTRYLSHRIKFCCAIVNAIGL